MEKTARIELLEREAQATGCCYDAHGAGAEIWIGEMVGRVRLLPPPQRDWQADATQAVKDLIDATQCLARPGTHQAGGGPYPIEESVRIPAAPERVWCHFDALRCPVVP